jgi:FlaA1/EpsC-like NDP-sugar epimerase
MITRYAKIITGFVFLSDILLLNLALYSSLFIGFNNLIPQFIPASLILIINIVWAMVSVFSKNYIIKRPSLLLHSANRFLITLICHLLLVTGVMYFLKEYTLPVLQALIIYALFFVFTIIHRCILILVLDHIGLTDYNQRRVVLIGDGVIASRLLNSVTRHPEYGYTIVDYVSDKQINNLTETDLFNKLISKRPHEIVICYRELKEDKLKTLLSFGDGTCG